MEIKKSNTVRNSLLKDSVKKTYGSIAEGHRSSCCSSSSPCGCGGEKSFSSLSEELGYSKEDLAAVPEGSNLGLGCGNPRGIAQLKPGETVLDLGSGAGFDAFLALRQVNPGGKVIGVDMTPQMVDKARQNAARQGYANVEFRLGEIEALPIENESIDVIISNCVINLSTDKPKVFSEAFRVLKPGGRLAVSDVVATALLPESAKDDPIFHSSCVAGAATIDEVAAMLIKAGFVDIAIEPKVGSKAFIKDWLPGTNAADYIVSASIMGKKPM